MKEEFKMELFSDIKTPSISLLSSKIVKALDTQTGLEDFTYDQIAMVKTNWKICPCDELTNGEITSSVLQMEYDLLYPTQSTDSSLYQYVWNSQLSLAEKIQVICPRKRTMLGICLLDLLKHPLLHTETEAMLTSPTTIDRIVTAIIQARQESYRSQVESTEKAIEDKKQAIKSFEQTLKNQCCELYKLRLEAVALYRKQDNKPGRITMDDIEKDPILTKGKMP